MMLIQWCIDCHNKVTAEKESAHRLKSQILNGEQGFLIGGRG
jgi:hypothetical protein